MKLSSVRRISTGIGETFWDITCNLYFDFKYIFQLKRKFHCLNMLIEHVVSCKSFDDSFMLSLLVFN